MKSRKWRDWVLKEDQHFLALNKPAGISCLDERGQNPNLSLLKSIQEENPHWTLGHRIDKETSGVLLVCKTPDAYKYLSSMFENHEVSKLYLAVVRGKPPVDEELLELPLQISKSGKSKVVSGGKWAATWIKAEKQYRTHAIIYAMPVSGRLHQIRVHCAYSGYPLVADKKYGCKMPLLSDLKRNYKAKAGLEERPLIDRLALHAQSIRFETWEGKTWEAEAPVPKDMLQLVKILDKYDQ